MSDANLASALAVAHSREREETVINTLLGKHLSLQASKLAKASETLQLRVPQAGSQLYTVLWSGLRDRHSQFLNLRDISLSYLGHSGGLQCTKSTTE